MRPETADGGAPGNNETTLEGRGEQPQRAAADDVVVKGRAARGSESELLQLHQGLAINCDLTVMFGNFKVLPVKQASKNDLLARQRGLKETCTSAANRSVVRLDSESDAQPVVTSQDSNKHQCHWITRPKHSVKQTGKTNAVSHKKTQLFGKDRGKPIWTREQSTDFIEGLALTEDFLFDKVENLPIVV